MLPPLPSTLPPDLVTSRSTRRDDDTYTSAVPIDLDVVFGGEPKAKDLYSSGNYRFDSSSSTLPPPDYNYTFDARSTPAGSRLSENGNTDNYFPKPDDYTVSRYSYKPANISNSTYSIPAPDYDKPYRLGRTDLPNLAPMATSCTSSQDADESRETKSTTSSSFYSANSSPYFSLNTPTSAVSYSEFRFRSAEPERTSPSSAADNVEHNSKDASPGIPLAKFDFYQPPYSRALTPNSASSVVNFDEDLPWSRNRRSPTVYSSCETDDKNKMMIEDVVVSSGKPADVVGGGVRFSNDVDVRVSHAISLDSLSDGNAMYSGKGADRAFGNDFSESSQSLGDLATDENRENGVLRKNSFKSASLKADSGIGGKDEDDSEPKSMHRLPSADRGEFADEEYEEGVDEADGKACHQPDSSSIGTSGTSASRLSFNHNDYEYVPSPDCYSLAFPSTFPTLSANDAAVEDLSVGQSEDGRVSFDERNKQELPAISEESEMEHGSSRKSSLDQVETGYPVTHCSSEPSNCFGNVAMRNKSNSILHRRVVSDHSGDASRLKRSNEEEHVDRIGIDEMNNSKVFGASGRCRSLMLVGQERRSSVADDNDDDDEYDDDENVVDKRRSSSSSDRAANEQLVFAHQSASMLNSSASLDAPIYFGKGLTSSSSMPAAAVTTTSSEPPPVRLSRKASSSTTRSTSGGRATDQSWKSQFPPFAACHTVYSPSSIPTRDLQRAADIGGTISAGSMRPGKAGKKEKSGSDTFTFGNLFRKKQPRGNLHEIVHDLDNRGTPPSGGSTASSSLNMSPTNPSGGLNPARRSVSATMAASDSSSLEQNFFDGLPDHITRMVLPSEIGDSQHSLPTTSESLPLQLEARWGRYGLFQKEEFQSWHEKTRPQQMSADAINKQDAIHELYMIEKRQCANIAFLMQGYRLRMLDEQVISVPDMNVLIPDVLDPLLMFHLRILERLMERMHQTVEVATIADIIGEELASEGTYTALCINAYTTFGAGKQRSDDMYMSLMNKNGKFADFIRKTSQQPLYRSHEFKALTATIIGRATKYSLVLETILRNEQPFSKEHELTLKAIDISKRFAARIDNNLSVAQMTRRWEELRAAIDPSSATKIYMANPDRPETRIAPTFGLESLNVAERRLRCIGEVFLKDGQHLHTKGNRMQIHMVLFDDILVVLYRKGTRLHFLPDQGVFPVDTLLIRTPERGLSVMIISKPKPALLEIEFANKTDRSKWITAFETASAYAPKSGVRLAADNRSELQRQVERQHRQEDDWLQQLSGLFKTREEEEEMLCKYLQSRMDFFDQLRSHIAHGPFPQRNDIPERIKKVVGQRFRELRNARTTPLNRLVERMNDARDADLCSFFDDAADAADLPDKSSELSDDSSGSESGARKPRRFQTFHGTSQQPEQSATYDKYGLRRHTTVPRMNSEGGRSGAKPSMDRVDADDNAGGDEEEGTRSRGDSTVQDRRNYDDLRHKLPLGLSLKARRASTKLIKDVIELRKDNHLLRNDNALMKSRIALLERTRGGSGLASASTVGESMEALRRKEQQIRDLQKSLEERETELEMKYREIDKQEAELASKWTALHGAERRANERPQFGNFRSPTMAQPVSPNIETTLTPALLNLTTKSEVKKTKK